MMGYQLDWKHYPCDRWIHAKDANPLPESVDGKAPGGS